MESADLTKLLQLLSVSIQLFLGGSFSRFQMKFQLKNVKRGRESYQNSSVVGTL